MEKKSNFFVEKNALEFVDLVGDAQNVLAGDLTDHLPCLRIAHGDDGILGRFVIREAQALRLGLRILALK